LFSEDFYNLSPDEQAKVAHDLQAVYNFVVKKQKTRADSVADTLGFALRDILETMSIVEFITLYETGTYLHCLV